MKVGVLESKSDRYINDVVSNLSGVEVEFLSFRHQKAPIASDYRVIVDRASFCHTYLKETMKNMSLGGAYVINNPFAATATNKLLDIGIAEALGISFPKTFVLPGVSSSDETEEWIGEPLWEEIIDEVGLPCVLKPFDGYAWTDVHMINSIEELKQVYNSTCVSRVVLVQKLIRYEDYYRVFCLDKKEVLFIKWIPKPLSMGQYLDSDLKPIEGMINRLTELTIKLNVCLDLDVNAVEWCIDEYGHPWVIDAFNDVPEINKEALPEAYYDWMVKRFVDCIKDKLNSDKRNKTVFLSPRELKDAAPNKPNTMIYPLLHLPEI
jgi:hypothetical protein